MWRTFNLRLQGISLESVLKSAAKRQRSTAQHLDKQSHPFHHNCTYCHLSKVYHNNNIFVWLTTKLKFFVILSCDKWLNKPAMYCLQTPTVFPFRWRSLLLLTLVYTLCRFFRWRPSDNEKALMLFSIVFSLRTECPIDITITITKDILN